jgi:hypothetical protein
MAWARSAQNLLTVMTPGMDAWMAVGHAAMRLAQSLDGTAAGETTTTFATFSDAVIATTTFSAETPPATGDGGGKRLRLFPKRTDQ